MSRLYFIFWLFGVSLIKGKVSLGEDYLDSGRQVAWTVISNELFSLSTTIFFFLIQIFISPLRSSAL